MKSILIAVFLSLFAAQAGAQDISLKMDMIDTGSYVVFKRNDGKVLLNVFRRMGGKRLKVDAYYGTDADREFVATTIFNKQGEIVSYAASDGHKFQYAPHYCTRTLGVCYFTTIHPDGQREKMRRVTKVTRNGFKSQLFHADGRLVVSTNIDLGPHGYPADSVYRIANGKVVRLKRIASKFE